MENNKRIRPAMEVRGLCFAYGDTKVLKGVDLKIEQGKITTILGANGCGKSTLFNLMTKNLIPNRGQIFLKGKNISNLSQKEFAQKVAIVHQYNTAPADMTVEELVRLGRTPHKQKLSCHMLDKEYVEWAMQVTGIMKLKDREIARLSGGQRQRVWIAMALAQDTNILFLDEPTTYLDIRYQIEILELIRKLNREYNITIIMVLHDINQAISFSDVIIGLKGGKVKAQGEPNEVITPDTIQSLYGIELKVTEEGGEKVVVASKRDGEIKTEQSMPARPKIVKESQGTKKKSRSRLVRGLWAVFGCICLALGTLGVVLPILPTVPFYLVTIFCFAKSSDRLYNWFTSTKLYHKHLESFVKQRAMTVKTKATIMITVTIVMGLGFFMMSSVPVARMILAGVWVMHIIIFVFVIKTISPEEDEL
ncbi:MAG: DUF454 family protein [Eubacterium sp.]|nr:DUF454 family protein [Eubacterium sp.]